MNAANHVESELSDTIYIVDDDRGSRDALEALFTSVSLPVSVYASPEAFLDEVKDLDRGCIVLDLRMPGMSGLELQDRLQQANCHVPIIFLSGHGNITSAVRAMHAGATDFMTKPVDDEKLIEAVREAMKQSASQRGERARREQSQQRLARLTRRERQVMGAVVEGFSSKEIGLKLHISYRTVELHRSHIMEKLGVGSIAELVQLHVTAQ